MIRELDSLLYAPELLTPNEKPSDFSSLELKEKRPNAFYFPFSDSNNDIEGNRVATKTGTDARGVDGSGQHFNFTGATRLSYPNFSPSALPAWGYVKFKRNALAQWSRLIWTSQLTGLTQYGVWMQINTSNQLELAFGTGGTGISGRRAFDLLQAGDQFDSTSEIYTVAWCIRGNADATIVVNGIEKVVSLDGTGTTYDPGTNDGSIGALYHDSVWYNTDDRIYDAYITEGQVQDEFLKDVSRNPYLLLKSKSSFVPYIVAGGTALNIDDATSNAIMESANLTQNQSLTIIDAISNSEIDFFSVLQTHSFTLENITSTPLMDSVALSQQHVLTIIDMQSDSVMDLVPLSQQHVFNIADIVSASFAENIIVNQEAGTIILIPLDAESQSFIDNLVLMQDQAMTIEGLESSTFIDSLVVALATIGIIKLPGVTTLTPVRTLNSLTPVREVRTLH